MLPENLFLPISLDLLAALVPTDDVSFGVQHENGVIGDVRHKEAEPLFALAQRLGGAPGIGDVAPI